jgi:hypothetical protein
MYVGVGGFVVMLQVLHVWPNPVILVVALE